MGENNCELKNKFSELIFTFGHVLNNTKKILVVTQCSLTFLPPFEYTCIQVTIEEVCSYEVHVLLEGNTVRDDAEVCALLKFSNVSYMFCPGIKWAYYYDHYFDVIHFYLREFTPNRSLFSFQLIVR